MEELNNITISEVTRRNIFDELRLRPVCWAGRLTETEFLSRIFNLDKLRSTDSRLKTAAEDIGLHREHFCDWPDDWIYADYRFGLMDGPDETFLRFLCEMIHPVVRPDEDEAEYLLEMFNLNLNRDGWEIIATTYISNKPVFSARRRILDLKHSISNVREIAKGLNANYINQQMIRMQASIESDPELAIGTAKELVETCCKTILSEKGVGLENKLDLPKLMRITLKELNLLPEHVDKSVKGAEAARRVLSSFANVTQGMTELRSLYGTGHGKHGKSKAIKPRHAKLAVGAATTLAIFLFETFNEPPNSKVDSL